MLEFIKAIFNLLDVISCNFAEIVIFSCIAFLIVYSIIDIKTDNKTKKGTN